jgi:hypothetical protein
MWTAALEWYRSGVHPAIQICVRRPGAVILNRAIGHAQGNGPADRKDTQKVPITVDTPLCVFDLQGDHRLPGAQTHRARPARTPTTPSPAASSSAGSCTW